MEKLVLAYLTTLFAVLLQLSCVTADPAPQIGLLGAYNNLGLNGLALANNGLLLNNNVGLGLGSGLTVGGLGYGVLGTGYGLGGLGLGGVGYNGLGYGINGVYPYVAYNYAGPHIHYGLGYGYGPHGYANHIHSNYDHDYCDYPPHSHRSYSSFNNYRGHGYHGFARKIRYDSHKPYGRPHKHDHHDY